MAAWDKYITYYDAEGHDFDSDVGTMDVQEWKARAKKKGASGLRISTYGSVRYFIRGGASDRWHEYGEASFYNWKAHAAVRSFVKGA